MQQQNRRAHTRFKPDLTQIAWIAFDPRLAASFIADRPALIIEESYGGCCLLVTDSGALEPLAECLLKVGDAGPLRAQVRWIKELDGSIRKIGFKYLT